MQKPIWKPVAIFLTAVVLASIKVQADDSAPPCWRGGSNTTYQSWVFTVSNSPAVPEVFNNPNGTPAATMTIGAFGKGWLATSFGGRTGLWELGRAGQVSLSVSNFAGFVAAPKYVQVQVTYFEDTLAYRPPTVSIAGATLVSLQTLNNLAAPPGNWKTQVSLWQISSAPNAETIIISGDPTKGLLIDQIIVDTRIAAGGDGDVPLFQPCWRGLAGSTFQHWAFGMSNSLAAVPAELVTNSFGVPAAGLVLGPFSSGYISDISSFFGCRQGIWDLGQLGTMTLNIPNDPSGTAGSYKYVQVQVTQLRDGIYAQNAAVNLTGGTLVDQQEQVVETNLFGGIWFVEKTLWRLGPPCPANESIVITGGTNGSLIDQVVIDTLCISQPCPPNLIASADSGLCSKSNVTWAVPTIDGCVVTNVVCVPPLGSTFAVGTNAVTCVVYDLHGGARTCNFTVTIVDDELPTIVCPTNMIIARDPAQCGAIVNFTPLAMDNCSAVSVIANPPSGSLFPLGLTTVTVVAQDASGNSSAPCTFTVQVVDFTGDLTTFQPCWRGAVGSTFQQWAFGVSNNPVAIFPELMTNTFGVSQAAITVGPFSSGYLDQYAFLGCRQGIWDLGQLGTLTVNVPNTPVSMPDSYKYVQVAVTQYRDSIYAQNAAVAIGGGVLVSQQEQTIETNGIGGLWVVEKTVWRLGPPCPSSETIVLTGGTNGSLIDQIVVDTLCLDFPCPTDIIASADLGLCSKSNVMWTLPLVDGCVVTNLVSVPPSGSTFPVGTNPVSVVIYDIFGGTKTCNFSVVVNDDLNPTAICQNITVFLNGAGQANISGVDVDGGSTDNCGIASRVVSPDSFTCANIGSNSATLTVTDIHGNVATCNATVTVLDNLAPSFVCPPALTNNADVGQCNWTFTLPPLVVTDNCGLLSVSSNAPASFPIGVTTVTWTAVDVNDNTNTCTQLVVVVDNQLPQIVCPENLITNATDDCSQVVAWITPAITDNCTITNIVCVPPSGSTFPVGTNTVNYTVWDNSGNTNVCSFTVTVNASAELALSMTAAPNPVTLGSNVIYTITISNAGPCTASGVVVSNVLSAGQVALMVTNQANVGMGSPVPGPVAWWPAEGNAVDAVGANHGTASGGVDFITGMVGQTFNFDGINDSVSVPDAPALRPQSLTVEGWIKIQDVTGVHVILGKRFGVGTMDSYSMWIGSGVLFASMADTNGSGPFMTYPEFPTSSSFGSGDLVDLESFAFALQPAVPADQVSLFIKTNLEPATTILLAAYSGGPDPALKQRLIQDLNQIIGNGSIYDVARFAGVTLTPETQYILGRNPLGTDLVRLNRYLIRDAYPTNFAVTVFPQLNQWFHVAYSFDDITKVQALYVNGNLVNAGFVNKAIAYDTHPVLIGADDDEGSPGYFYQGAIDELALYDRALTGAEIQAAFKAGSAGKYPVAGTITIGNIAAGATAAVAFTGLPTNCLAATANASVSAVTFDPNLGNNASTALVIIQEQPAAEWLLNIERVSLNNNLLRISWPMTCGLSFLETTTNLNAPIIWETAIVPVQFINSRNTTIVPASEAMRYFRLNAP